MDLPGELGRVHEIEANQENVLEETRETLLFLAARITKSHSKGKKKLLKENRSRKGKIKPREKKNHDCSPVFFFHSNLTSKPRLDVLDDQTYRTRAIEVWTRGAGSRTCVAQLSDLSLLSPKAYAPRLLYIERKQTVSDIYCRS